MKLNLNSHLSQKSMLVTLKISVMGSTKYDKSASAEVTQAHGADTDAARVYKRLIKKDQLAEINTVAGEVRNLFYTNTLPWNDDGTRILPASEFFNFTQKFNALVSKFKNAVSNFVPRYAAILSEAQASLGSLFDPNEFTPQHLIADKFSIGVKFLPMPDITDWRVAIGNEELEIVKAEAQQQIAATINDATKSLFERLLGSVEECYGLRYMVHVLGTKDKIFRDSLIGNIQSTCELVRRLNITGDADLNACVDKIEREVASLDPKDIRKDEALREATAKTTQDIVDQMSVFMTQTEQD